MEEWITALLGGLGVAVIGVLGNVAIQWMQRRKHSADTGKTQAEETDILAGAAVRMVQTWEIQVAKLEKRVGELETALKDRDTRIVHLEGEMARLMKRNEQQDKQIREHSGKVFELTRGVAILSRQIKELGMVPDYPDNTVPAMERVEEGARGG